MFKRICVILLAIIMAAGFIIGCAPQETDSMDQPAGQTVSGPKPTIAGMPQKVGPNSTAKPADENNDPEPTVMSPAISDEPGTPVDVTPQETDAAEQSQATAEPAPQPEKETPAPEPEPTPEPDPGYAVLEVGDTGDAVQRVQERLIELGYLSGGADGVFGQMTRMAVEEFQRTNDLPVTGEVDGKTREVLFSSDAKPAEKPVETEPPEEPEEDLPLSGYVIGLDPGHQERSNPELEPEAPGSDVMKKKVSSGTEGCYTRVPEYKVNLEVALLLRDMLVKKGATVVMTRTTNNVNISNIERAQFFNRKKTDYALRLHCNGTDDMSRQGAFMLVPTKNPYLSECNSAAQLLIDEYCKATGANNLGVTKRSDQTGFNWCERMIINIEMGHMSNKEEDMKLTDRDYQKKMAQGLLNGILAYFKK